MPGQPPHHASAARSKLDRRRREPSFGQAVRRISATVSLVATVRPAAGLISTLACNPKSNNKATASSSIGTARP